MRYKVINKWDIDYPEWMLEYSVQRETDGKYYHRAKSYKLSRFVCRLRRRYYSDLVYVKRNKSVNINKGRTKLCRFKITDI